MSGMPAVGRVQMRGPATRAFALGVVLALAGCASTPPPSPPTTSQLRPSPQALGGHQLVGDVIVASLGGVSASVRALSEQGAEAYYAGRPGLVPPWPREIWRESPPTLFLLRLRNQTRGEVQLDPALALLVTQDGQRHRPIPYEEMHMRLAGAEAEQARLRSLQATILSRFLVLAPGAEREGILIFPALEPKAKHVILELGSLFVGGTSVPAVFEFQVTPTPRS